MTFKGGYSENGFKMQNDHNLFQSNSKGLRTLKILQLIYRGCKGQGLETGQRQLCYYLKFWNMLNRVGKWKFGRAV